MSCPDSVSGLQPGWRARRRFAFAGALVLALLTGMVAGSRAAATGGTTAAGLPPLAVGHPGGGSPGATGPVRGVGEGAEGALIGPELRAQSAGGDGYRLEPLTTIIPVGRTVPWRFQIAADDGSVATNFVADQPVELIVVRRDLTGPRVLRPRLEASGIWSVPLLLPAGGVWRVYADFTVVSPAGRQTATTLAVDVSAAGSYLPVAAPPVGAARVAGYTVDIVGEPQVSRQSPVDVRLRRGRLPTGFEARNGGRLFVLRESDAAWVEVYTEPTLTAAGTLRCWFRLPAPGRYRALVVFHAGGREHAAVLTLART